MVATCTEWISRERVSSRFWEKVPLVHGGTQVGMHMNQAWEIPELGTGRCQQWRFVVHQAEARPLSLADLLETAKRRKHGRTASNLWVPIIHQNGASSHPNEGLPEQPGMSIGGVGAPIPSVLKFWGPPTGH